MARLGAVILLTVSASLVAVPALAQGAADPTEAAHTAKLEEARQRYERGLQLFAENNFDASRVEFERAYELAPSYRLLYNIGLAHEQLGDYVVALKMLERYLAEGGAEVNAARREDVAKELAQIKPRIAYVTVTTNVPSADLQLDDVALGASPQTSVPMNPGRRKISATKEGYFPATKVVTLAGSDHVDVVVQLQKIPATSAAVEKRNPFVVPAYVGWGVTGATLIGTGVFGVLALKARDDQNTKLSSVTSSTGTVLQSDLQSARTKTQSLAAVTDILGATTIVAAGVSGYLTYRAAKFDKTKEGTPSPSQPSVAVQVTPFGASAFGTF